MPRRRAETPSADDIPVLPPFPSESFDVLVTLADDTTETIKVMARGPVSAIRTAGYTMEKWPNEKISQITGLSLTKR